MKKIINKLFCLHEWNLLYKEDIYTFLDFKTDKQKLFDLKHKIYTNSTLIYSCKNCGKIHREDI